MTLTTAATITDEQIAALRASSASAGDLAQVMICDRALGEYEPLEHATEDERKIANRFRVAATARAECARVISDAEAMAD